MHRCLRAVPFQLHCRGASHQLGARVRGAVSLDPYVDGILAPRSWAVLRSDRLGPTGGFEVRVAKCVVQHHALYEEARRVDIQFGRGISLAPETLMRTDTVTRNQACTRGVVPAQCQCGFIRICRSGRNYGPVGIPADIGYLLSSMQHWIFEGSVPMSAFSTMHEVSSCQRARRVTGHGRVRGRAATPVYGFLPTQCDLTGEINVGNLLESDDDDAAPYRLERCGQGNPSCRR